MKNLLVLLMALALIGSASAGDYAVGGPWGIAGNGLNPYGFDVDGNLTDLTEGTGSVSSLWGTWGDSAAGAGSVVVSGGECTATVTTGAYELAFSHDNAFVDMGVTAGVNKIELVLQVVSATGTAIVKIEQFDLATSFPNPDTGAPTVVADTWDPDSTITGPGEYHFITAAEADAGAVAATAVFGTNGTLVIEQIWIGAEGTYPGATKATNPGPAHNSINPSGTITQCTWTLPLPIDEVSAVSSIWRFEVELSTDGSGNYVYDPNWGAANGIPVTTRINTKGAGVESQNFGFATSPYTLPLADGLYSWRVDAVDASPGGVTTEGNVWLFTIGDAPAVVSQPADQYMFLSQTDGDLDSNIRTFTVEFDYTDDGKSPITAADVNNLNWGWDPDGLDDIQGNEDDERGIRLVSVVKTPDPALPATITAQNVVATFETVYDEDSLGNPVSPSDPNYQTDIMGYWNIRLEVTDGTGTVLGTAGHHEIWELCGEAAVSDPGDSFHPDQLNSGLYDADNDCEIGLTDFQAYVAMWLEQSVLLD